MGDDTHMPTFGRVATAMVTPFTATGDLDLDAARRLARHLITEQANDALVISGTTGESPTTTDAEKLELLRAVIDEVGGEASVIAGVGTFSTHHTIELARQAADAGADGVLVVTPYYSKPSQEGVLQHFTAAAQATDLPMMVYDIPHRSAVPIETETMLRLAELPTVVAVKDAKGDLEASSRVIAGTDLQYYSGDDPLTLPYLAIGAVGVVGTSTHFSGRAMAALIEAFTRHDIARAQHLHREWFEVFAGVFAAPGVTMVKGTLAALGTEVGGVRLPQVAADAELVASYAALVRSLSARI